jgi:glucose-6-phosphate 1-dehydrogenase
MDFSYQQHFSGTPEPTAYERVLVDAIRGDRSLFASSQEVLASWRIIDDVVHAWQRDGTGLQTYPKGTEIDTIQNYR